jgi:hypothetical protein
MCAVQDSFKHMEKGDRQLRVERGLPMRSSRNQERELGLAQHCARDSSEDPFA